jgi:ribosomal protein S6--L-glutamate ligase/gamma-F420-2:alpha-L-glutamate ligase
VIKVRIAILHQDLEWAERELKKKLIENGAEVALHDVRHVDRESLMNSDLVLNRVYASVANRNYRDNNLTLDLLDYLEKKSVKCLNSANTTRADYSKFSSYEMMKSLGVPNPETIKIESVDDILMADEFADDKGYPIVVKRDMGGRGKEVCLIKDRRDLVSHLQKVFIIDSEQPYQAGFVVQEFISSNRDYDCRINIINGNYVHSFSRSLIPYGSDIAWLASTSNGSIKRPYQPSDNEIAVAIAATNSIGALFNEVDMAFTEKGPVIIENNPTPNYVENEDDHMIDNAVKHILIYAKEIL